MLSRRKLLGFWAAAPVVGPVLAKAAQSENGFGVELGRSHFLEGAPYKISGDLIVDGSIPANRITVNNPTPHGVRISTKDGKCHIAYGKVIISD